MLQPHMSMYSWSTVMTTLRRQSQLTDRHADVHTDPCAHHLMMKFTSLGALVEMQTQKV